MHRPSGRALEVAFRRKKRGPGKEENRTRNRVA